MSTIEAGVIIALFLAVIGCYTFTFSTSRSITNHVYSKIDKIKEDLESFCLDVTDRLARIETALNAGKKKKR